MKKKILSVMLAVAMIFSLAATLCVTVSAETLTSGDFMYSVLDDGTIMIDKYNGSAVELDIPSTIAGKTVTVIGSGAFSYCESLTSVTIPDSAKEIGRYAFQDCTSLTSVTIPNSVTEIGGHALGYYYYYDNDDNGYKKIPNFHINCYKGTAGEKYAIDNGFDYTLLKPSVVIDNPNSDLGTVEKIENEDGTVTLNVKINGTKQFDKWDISGDYEIVNGDLTSMSITIRLKSDSVKVSPSFEGGANIKYGDVNGDDKVTAADVLLIRKSIAGQNVTLNKTAADVNCDDKLTAADVLLVRKFIAGQNVTLGK